MTHKGITLTSVQRFTTKHLAGTPFVTFACFCYSARLCDKERGSDGDKIRTPDY